jgi:uncharacterized phiE125 gp8 family phage protein
MTTKSTTPPAALAVSLAAAKESLRIDAGDTALDASITLWIKGITLEAEHQLGRSLINQGWRLSLDAFPDALRLDHPPTVSVESVKYFDTNNVQQTLDPADYMVDKITEPGYIVPAAGKAWPDTFDRIHAVEVNYTAGYGSTEADVPVNVQLYVLARLVEQFDSTGREFKETAQSKFVERLLDRCRTYG